MNICLAAPLTGLGAKLSSKIFGSRDVETGLILADGQREGRTRLLKSTNRTDSFGE